MNFRFERWGWGVAMAAAWLAWPALADDAGTNGTGLVAPPLQIQADEMPPASADAATNAAPATDAPLTVGGLIDRAVQEQVDGKLDQADRDVSRALAMDPKNVRALDMRASLYFDEKYWDSAQRDYTTLNQISPDPSYQYKLAEIKYRQSDFSNARPLFAALGNDARLGDLARYMVFMCDLRGGHEAIAARDLGTLDRTGQQPSFYFGQGVWALYHDQRPTTSRLFAQATGRFSSTICGLYTAPLTDIRPFQLSTASFITKDGKQFSGSPVALESDGLRVETRQGWQTIPLNQLPDDLTPFPAEMRDEIGKRRTGGAAATATATSVLSFTTRSGKTYGQVRWMLGDSGLEVLTDDGWISVPFDDLPADRSTFPAGLQKELAERSKEAGTLGNSTTEVSFTTREGKRYEEVRAWLGDDGVRVLSQNGWVTIPFADLPVNLSPFPPGWQPQIEASQRAREAGTSLVTVVSFTSRKGTVYHDVRAALDSDGVRVLTPDGWTTVAFADLPADLAAFPADWRSQIQAGLKPHVDDGSGMEIVSFTTKRGRSYDRVRTALDDEGLRVLGPDGWVVVTYDQVPEDLSPFPATWRATIAARQKTAAGGKQ
jgi:hypothetical protein